MEEKCDGSADTTALDPSAVVSKKSNEGGLINQPIKSKQNFMSSNVHEKDFKNSQQDFAETLDDETTITSGVLDTFENSSSNSLPTCSEAPAVAAAEAVDNVNLTATINLVKTGDPAAASICNNTFFRGTEIYIINDYDEDKHKSETERNDCIDDKRSHTAASHIGDIEGQLNGVIVTTNSGASVYLETPVIEEQQQHHPQIVNFTSHVNYAENTCRPKRLSDEFLLAEHAETLMDDEDDEQSFNISESSVKHSFTVSLAPAQFESLAEDGGGVNVDLQHDKMSIRLKKMNINNSLAVGDCHLNTYSSNAALDEIIASSSNLRSISQRIVEPSVVDIESMDLIERRDFETEQRLTGEIIIKSSSFKNKNKLNLNLIKSCIQQQESETGDDFPSSSSGRAVSSDSKCAYKDLTTTPTSSRICNNRLTKSTAKLNLYTTLSHSQQKQQQRTTPIATMSHSQHQLQKLASSTSSSVIVEASSTSANVFAVAEVFSNSNSNDSLLGGGGGGDSVAKNTSPAIATEKTSTNCLQKLSQKQQLSTPAIEYKEFSGCSRTSVPHPPVVAESAAIAYQDAQPSTSSARCQYAPLPRSMRQVHASAQTQERYLMRSGSASAVVASSVLPLSSSYLTTATSSTSNSTTASTSGANGMNLCSAGRNSRRRADPTAHLSRNSTSEEVIAAFKVVVAEAAAAAAVAESVEFNEDTCADCEEQNSDLEEICTCHNSSSSGGSSSGNSSHGGSNTSLNETVTADDLDSTVGCAKDDLSNYIQLVSISEETTASPSSSSYASSTQRKRKHIESRLLNDSGEYSATNICSNGGGGDTNSRKRIAYDYASTPRTSYTQTSNCSGGGGALLIVTTPSTSHLAALSANGSPHGRRTPRSIIPTRDNPPPELQHWLAQFTRWSHAERLLALDRLIEHCEPTQVRHMMKVIEPQFQRDFISLLPRELALQVLAYLAPKDLLRAAQTCRSWRFLCDDNLLWKEKCRKAQILTEPRSDRPKRGRAGNMPPIASPWKAAYMRQHIIEMNWRSRPIREPKVLKGHDDHVITCLQFCGNRIVSGSDDNTLKVWSAVTGRCMRTLVGHTGGVWSSQMSGNIIISGSTDRTLKVWDMESGQCVHTLLGHTSTVRCMHLHGNKVVSGSRDATLRVWDIEQGSCLHVLVGHLAAVRCVQYDGKLIVSGAYDYMVKIWHPERQECLHTLQGHTNRVYSLQFDGVHVVSGSLDTSIRVWDVETGNCKHTLMGHQSLTSGMELRQNILVSGNADSTVKVWDITTGQCLQTLSGPNKHQSAVTCLQFNSRFVVTSSDDGTVKLWDVKTGDFIRNLVALDSGGSGGVVWRIRANDTKLICAVGSRNGTEETKLMVLDFDVEGACVKCS